MVGQFLADSKDIPDGKSSDPSDPNQPDVKEFIETDSSAEEAAPPRTE